MSFYSALKHFLTVKLLVLILFALFRLNLSAVTAVSFFMMRYSALVLLTAILGDTSLLLQGPEVEGVLLDIMKTGGKGAVGVVAT